MSFVQNFPFFSIILSMFSGIISSVLPGKWAKRVCLFMLSAVCLLSACVLLYVLQTGESFVYLMGHFPAPWGNEIRAGVLEALLAMLFAFIMLASLLGGMSHIFSDVEDTKINMYFILVDLMASSLLALIYTNDLFTAYVFVEINTIAACGLIMIRQVGRTTVAALRYMVMSLLGSGLFLIALSMLYDVTGHLLMPNIQTAVAEIMTKGSYAIPMTVIIGLMTVGLAIKSGLYPFHTWMPDAYGYSTASSSAILSGLVSKGYIILLIKIFYRVIGIEFIVSGKVENILYLFGVIGIIMGSVSAIQEDDIRRMIAFSSVAQIGYIYMGLGLGTTEGVVASVFHILAHGVTKALLFISAIRLSDVSGGSKKFRDLRGAGYRSRPAGIAFTIGALSMVGLPMLSGFISKLLFAQAAVLSHSRVLATLLVLAVSTVLNAIYFLRTVVTIYSPSVHEEYERLPGNGWKTQPAVLISYVFFLVMIFGLGMFSQPVVDMIQMGLHMFS